MKDREGCNVETSCGLTVWFMVRHLLQWCWYNQVCFYESTWFALNNLQKWLQCFVPQTHQYFAVGSVLTSQTDPHPLIISVTLACLPTRLSLLVSWKTMRAVCRRWVISTEDVLEQVTCYLTAIVSFLGFILLFLLNVQVVFTQLTVWHLKTLKIWNFLSTFSS